MRRCGDKTVSEGVELFPHVLLRVSGGPFGEFESLNVPESMKVVEEKMRLQGEVDQLKEKISSALYEIIPLLADKKLQNLMLNFRRDVYNERPFPPRKMEQLQPHLPDTVKEDWRQYRELTEAMRAIHQKGRETFNREMAGARQSLRSLAEGKTLQKGLLLASQSLLERIASYLGRGAQLRKKDFQTEKSLIKYLSRMYAKTSPFSTFTNLATARIGSSAALFSFNRDSQPRTRNHIRLNNFLYQFLRGLLSQHREIAYFLPVRPNPTLKQQDDHYVFLTNSNNIEAFQRIPGNPVLEVFRVLSGQQRQGIAIGQLIQTIVDNEYIDAPAEEIEAYLRQLIDYGFLEFNFGVSGIDPDWDIKLREQLAAAAEKIPLVTELTGVLAEVRQLAERYGEAGVDSRKEILEQAFARFRGICMKLHQAAGLPEEERKSAEELKKIRQQQEQKRGEDEEKTEEEQEEVFRHRSNTYFYFKPEQMFYEDTTVETSGEIDGRSLSQFTASLHRLLQRMKRFEGHRDERDKMRHYFLQKYGPGARVDLFTFYEDYYREFKKPEARELEKPKQEQSGAFEVPAAVTRREENKRWQERLTAYVKQRDVAGQQEIDIDFETVDRLNREIPDNTGEESGRGSYGAFVQFYVQEADDGKARLMGVLNASFPGFGKMFSRFLHVFEAAITEDVRRHNESLRGDYIFIEDTDASYFNANLHPPLMPFEIWMPSGHNSLPPERQIPITELQVRLDKESGDIRLDHQPTQKRAFVFDLGFQGQMGRSQLFQLLEKFTMVRYLFCMPLVNAVNRGLEGGLNGEKETGGKIRLQPRIVYEGSIVLQRQTWYVPRGELPFRQADEDDWCYFCRLNEWRRSLGIPDEVFIFLFNRWEREDIKAEEGKKIGRDDYKPQYISFGNPFLVTLFEKSLTRVPRTLRIVEMLPNSHQLLQLGQHRHIMEFLVQWCQDEVTHESAG
jgi:hypothetical protein